MGQKSVIQDGVQDALQTEHVSGAEQADLPLRRSSPFCYIPIHAPAIFQSPLTGPLQLFSTRSAPFSAPLTCSAYKHFRCLDRLCLCISCCEFVSRRSGSWRWPTKTLLCRQRCSGLATANGNGSIRWIKDSFAFLLAFIAFLDLSVSWVLRVNGTVIGRCVLAVSRILLVSRHRYAVVSFLSRLHCSLVQVSALSLYIVLFFCLLVIINRIMYWM